MGIPLVISPHFADIVETLKLLHRSSQLLAASLLIGHRNQLYCTVFPNCIEVLHIVVFTAFLLIVLLYLARSITQLCIY